MKKPHFLVAMLIIPSNPELNKETKIDVTQAASNQFKNLTENNWRYKDYVFAQEIREDGVRTIIISDEVKKYIRENILVVYINVHSETVAQQIDFWLLKISLYLHLISSAD